MKGQSLTMPEFFHVSRDPIPGITVFDRKQIDHEYWYIEDPGKITKEEYIASLSKLFPNGTTPHGEKYMLSRWRSAKDDSGNTFIFQDSPMEAIFEMVRMFKFPNIISRFEAVFGCKTIEDARQIRDITFNGKGQIYKVDCESFFAVDMRLLHTGHFFTSAIMYAEKYWSGEMSAEPFVEVLMEPPVKIVKQVD